MKYTKKIWKERHRHRSDISTYVTHLTRGSGSKDAFEILYEILNGCLLKGSSKENGFIIGDNSVVCFQDMPLYGVAQNSLHEQLNSKELGGKKRYNPIGLCFDKRYIFKKGGRPVIYEKKEVAKKMIPSNEWWRIVSFDLSNQNEIIDWTHEREWRIKGSFKFELKEAIIVFPRPANYKKVISDLGDMRNKIGGIVILDPVLS